MVYAIVGVNGVARAGGGEGGWAARLTVRDIIEQAQQGQQDLITSLSLNRRESR